MIVTILGAAVVLALLLFILLVFGVREVARQGPTRLRTIVLVGIAIGTVACRGTNQTAIAQGDGGVPYYGCCYTLQGPQISGVSRDYCFNVLGGIDWGPGRCGDGMPLGCCLDVYGYFWEPVTQADYYEPSSRATATVPSRRRHGKTLASAGPPGKRSGGFTCMAARATGGTSSGSCGTD